MDKQAIILAAEEFVKEKLAGEGTGHDWWHIERIRATARAIHATEGGDWFTIDLTLLLHDVGDRKVIGKDEDDYTIAENFLLDHQIDSAVIDHVMFIIKNMSFSKSLKNKREDASIEFYTVQDADRIDAIGAIGIARAFAFGGSKSSPLYDPTVEVKDFTSTKEYRQTRSSTLHHFEEKLFHIKDLLNTETAKKIAQGRDEYMHTFKEQFLDEWAGKK